MPTSSRMDTTLARTESISDGDSTSGATYLRSGGKKKIYATPAAFKKED